MVLPQDRVREFIRPASRKGFLAANHPDLDPADGIASQLIAITKAKFFADVGPVGIQCPRADAEPRGNVLVAFGLADQLENLHFTIGQAF